MSQPTEGGSSFSAEDTAATVALVPDRGQPASGPSGAAPDELSSGARSWSGEAARDSVWSEPVARALRGEEVARARGWAIAVVLLCAGAMAFLPLLPGTTAMKTAFSFTMLLLGGTAVWAWVRAREQVGYDRVAFVVFGLVSATGSFELEYFLGVFSPTPLVVTLGITFFGMGLDRRAALIIPIYAIGGYVLMAALMTAGVIADRGALSSTGTPRLTLVFFTFMAPFVLGLSLWMARISRRSMAEAMQRAADATRLASEREAQLVEARADLEQALRAGAGQVGRYTGAEAERYLLAEVIGRGAMGEVYAATHGDSGQRAAVKILRPEAMERPQLLTRFLREGEMAGGLDVPNIVTVYQVGTLADDVPFIAMELLHGADLAAELRRKVRLDRDEVVALATQVGCGLEAAHGAGIIHRDLKPQNLFHHHGDAGRDPTWKILDFGVSKLADSRGTLTQHSVVGTPGYMSPEQARGKPVDARCDLFSLGAVLYRAITGRQPFGGRDLPQTLFEIVYHLPLRPSALVDDLPRDVDRALAVAMAKQPGDRFDNGPALAAALTSAYAGKLGRDLRRRADQLIERYPWGSSLPNHYG